MATSTLQRERSWNWLRVGAWSGSFATHIGMLLLVALPIAAPLTRPPPTTIEARWIETVPPEVLPEPPPPVVPQRPRQKPVRAVVPPTAPPVAPADATEPVAPAPETPTTVEPADASPHESVANDIGAGGATQTLAYATPVQPRYPPASARAREQGTVVLRVLVDAGGAPQRIEIERSSGHARLDAAARESVARARFRPVMRDGAAVSAWGLVPIAFRLDQG